MLFFGRVRRNTPVHMRGLEYSLFPSWHVPENDVTRLGGGWAKRTISLLFSKGSVLFVEAQLAGVRHVIRTLSQSIHSLAEFPFLKSCVFRKL